MSLVVLRKSDRKKQDGEGAAKVHALLILDEQAGLQELLAFVGPIAAHVYERASSSWAKKMD